MGMSFFLSPLLLYIVMRRDGTDRVYIIVILHQLSYLESGIVGQMPSVLMRCQTSLSLKPA